MAPGGINDAELARMEADLHKAMGDQEAQFLQIAGIDDPEVDHLEAGLVREHVAELKQMYLDIFEAALVPDPELKASLHPRSAQHLDRLQRFAVYGLNEPSLCPVTAFGSFLRSTEKKWRICEVWKTLHRFDPHPSKETKAAICDYTGRPHKSVTDWFTNFRARRFPMEMREEAEKDKLAELEWAARKKS
ncbi:hypothetical protein WJX72_010284 [[Myrmecia] bisecta]|uniref:KN homeodomain domain-containing protein n=1 Tax=[Myrmecia] bisecta TaxID=41462 RepID=A0AAW1PXQ9_9CHLO